MNHGIENNDTDQKNENLEQLFWYIGNVARKNIGGIVSGIGNIDKLLYYISLGAKEEKSLELDHLSIMKGGLRHASVAETLSFRILQIVAQDFSGDKLSEVLP